jgi:hypothetical protein
MKLAAVIRRLLRWRKAPRNLSEVGIAPPADPAEFAEGQNYRRYAFDVPLVLREAEHLRGPLYESAGRQVWAVVHADGSQTIHVARRVEVGD